MSDDATLSEMPTLQLPTPEIDSTEAGATETEGALQLEASRWPGWPGDNVFRLIVTVAKVGSIIGHKGELVKKMCEDTGARIRVFEGPLSMPDRIVLITGKEEPEAELSPAMDAVLRVFNCVNGLSSIESVDSADGGNAFCSTRLLVASSQAISLIGKQGSTIKSVQESTGATIRILVEDDLPSYATSDERVIDIHGETRKVLKALRAVLVLLRKFLVDRTVIPVFEKTYNATISRDHTVDPSVDIARSLLHTAPIFQTGTRSDYSLSLKRDPFMFEREAHLNSELSQSGLSRYGQDSMFGGLREPGLRHPGAHLVTQVTQTMQVPLSYAENIIGIGGSNIAYIRRTSGAILTIQESRGLPDEIIVEIKGTSVQVQTAQQLIQDFISTHKEPSSSMYRNIDMGSSMYSNMPETTYSASSYGSHLGGGGGGGGGGAGGGLGSSYASHLGGGGGGYGSSSYGEYRSSPNMGGHNSYRFLNTLPWQ